MQAFYQFYMLINYKDICRLTPANLEILNISNLGVVCMTAIMVCQREKEDITAKKQ